MKPENTFIVITSCLLSFTVLTIFSGFYLGTHKLLLSYIPAGTILFIFGCLLIPREYRKRFEDKQQNLREDKQQVKPGVEHE